MKFYKGHTLTPRVQKIPRVCEMCNQTFIANNFSQKYCGSALKKTGCSYKNRNKSYPQGFKDKECLLCNNVFTPKGKNQKYCGGKYDQFTCSWKNYFKKTGLSWLKGFTVKI